jgi:hypothetical protein
MKWCMNTGGKVGDDRTKNKEVERERKKKKIEKRKPRETWKDLRTSGNRGARTDAARRSAYTPFPSVFAGFAPRGRAIHVTMSQARAKRERESWAA